SRQRSRAAQAFAAAVVAAVTLVAIVPDAVSESGVAGLHAAGMVPLDLFGLLDSVKQLLYWLFLLLAIAVTVRLPPSPRARAAARDMALPSAVVLLYWFDTWLYLPISVIVGIFLIRRLMMPVELTREIRPSAEPETSIEDASAGW